MSSVEPNVAVKTLLYNNWNIGNPPKDSATEATLNPEKVWFGNRYYADTPPRIHSHHITVRGNRKTYRPWQLGGTGKYEVQEALTIHVWVLPGVTVDLEQAHTKMKAMLDEIRRIINNFGDTAGSGIQQIILGSFRDMSRLDRDPAQLYYQLDVIAVFYEGIT